MINVSKQAQAGKLLQELSIMTAKLSDAQEYEDKRIEALKWIIKDTQSKLDILINTNEG